MQIEHIDIEDSWKTVLQDEFKKPYFKDIKQFILQERQKGKTTYPPGREIFNAFKLTPFEKVKVVIIGQDPYHGKGQAHGLCFSVAHGMQPPPSLINIFKELQTDVGMEIPNHGNLEAWAKQGVLLLNAILTVNAREPASHKKAGWEYFTDGVIRVLNKIRTNLVFLLWGRFAQNKAGLVDSNKHLILRAAHPSPFSANNGFFGCKHFSKTNVFLASKGMKAIDWSLK